MGINLSEMGLRSKYIIIFVFLKKKLNRITMDLKDIQELIKFVAKSGATDVELEIDNIKISIKSPPKKRRGEEEDSTKIIQQIPAQIINPTVAPAPVPVAPAPAPATPAVTNHDKEKAAKEKAAKKPSEGKAAKK